MLALLGYEADFVTNGRDALEAWGRSSYGAVLLDCQMPVMDGYEAARAIRERETGGPRTPIVAVTAHALEGHREAALAAGMDDYVTKPVGAGALGAVLRRWVRPAGGDGEGPALDPAVRRSPKVAALFLEHTPNQLAEVAAAVESGDAEGLHRAAHKLKGSCLAVGAGPMASLLAELDRLGASGDLGGAARLVHELERAFDRVRAEIKVA